MPVRDCVDDDADDGGEVAPHGNNGAGKQELACHKGDKDEGADDAHPDNFGYQGSHRGSREVQGCKKQFVSKRDIQVVMNMVLVGSNAQAASIKHEGSPGREQEAHS